jgi:hypothetical protein
MSKEIKVIDSKGTLYNSCPFIDKIIELCEEQKTTIDKIKAELEFVREINSKLRGNQSYYYDSGFSEGQKELWDDVGYIFGIRKCSKRDLEDFFKEYEDLKEENEDLLKEITELKLEP